MKKIENCLITANNGLTKALSAEITVPAAPSLRGAPRPEAPSGGFAGGYGKRIGCYHAAQRGRCGYGVATYQPP